MAKPTAKKKTVAAKRAPVKTVPKPRRDAEPVASSRTMQRAAERARLAPGTQSAITPEMLAAAELTPEEREQQQADAIHDEIMAKTLANKVLGAGAMVVNDESDIPIVLGNFQGRAMQPVAAPSAREGFLDAVPPGIPREPPLQSEPASIQRDRLLRESAAGESHMNDRFDSLVPEQPQMDQGRPEMMMRGLRPQTDVDEATKIDEVNPIAKLFGARLWRKGRGAVSWLQQTVFTYHFFEQGVIVDIFDPEVFRHQEAAVRAEVAEKAALIEQHNERAAQPHGYIAFVMGYYAQPQEIDDVLAGTVCRTLRVGAIPQAPSDTYDSVRAASGDPFADAARRGETFQDGGWNRPRPGVQPARYAPSSEVFA